MRKADLAIIDYGVGNLFNVQRAFHALGLESVITRDPQEVLAAPRLLLPGVGAFEAGMAHLREYKLIEPVRAFARSGKPLLGICLGMQLLMSRSEENGIHEGLDLIPGQVKRFREPEGGAVFKIPQIGWNALLRPGKGDPWRGTILDGLGADPHMYFVHSYCVFPEDPAARLAITRYGRDEFCSVIQRQNVAGCQFHPERSGEYGLKILENFAKGLLAEVKA